MHWQMCHHNYYVPIQYCSNGIINLHFYTLVYSYSHDLYGFTCMRYRGPSYLMGLKGAYTTLNTRITRPELVSRCWRTNVTATEFWRFSWASSSEKPNSWTNSSAVASAVNQIHTSTICQCIHYQKDYIAKVQTIMICWSSFSRLQDDTLGYVESTYKCR